jgi:DNA-directed RNA polymerase specialized sigma24 family protein
VRGDQAEALAALRPALLGWARSRLRHFALDEQLAEDLTQEAIVRWLSSPKRWPDGRFRRQHIFRSREKLYAWLRSTVSNLAADIARRHPDALDNDPLSLNEPWARGE